jgi:hypothetical protein
MDKLKIDAPGHSLRLRPTQVALRRAPVPPVMARMGSRATNIGRMSNR